VDKSDILEAAFAEHGQVMTATLEAVARPFAHLVAACRQALAAGGKIMLFGNGGSAADAQHIAAELVGRFQRERAALAALALSTDSSALTAIANDYGFAALFARQVEGLGRAGDVAIGISTSGNSANVIAGLEAARAGGLTAAGLAGGDGGHMLAVAEPLLLVPSSVTARVQEAHITIGHALCQAIEAEGEES